MGWSISDIGHQIQLLPLLNEKADAVWGAGLLELSCYSPSGSLRLKGQENVQCYKNALQVVYFLALTLTLGRFLYWERNSISLLLACCTGKFAFALRTSICWLLLLHSFLFLYIHLSLFLTWQPYLVRQVCYHCLELCCGWLWCENNISIATKLYLSLWRTCFSSFFPPHFVPFDILTKMFSHPYVPLLIICFSLYQAGYDLGN